MEQACFHPPTTNNKVAAVDEECCKLCNYFFFSNIQRSVELIILFVGEWTLCSQILYWMDVVCGWADNEDDDQKI